MAGKKVESIVEKLAIPIVEKYAFDLVDVEYVKEGGNWYLRVFIDKPGGITIDDCQLVSEELGEEIDKIDPIKQAYFFEVSSPGLDRPLKKEKDFIRYTGQDVEVKTYEPMNGKKVFEGELLGLKDGIIRIRCKDSTEIEFEREKVASVKRVVRF